MEPATPPEQPPLLVVYGASGRTGRRVASHAARTLRVRAVVRDAARLPPALRDNPNVDVVVADLADDVPAAVAALDGATYAVCVAAGAPLSRRDGLAKLVDALVAAMHEKQVTRLLFQASALVCVPGEKLPLKMKVARAFYVACRCAGPTLRDHDQVLAVLKRHEDVQWVVVRPGRLVEGEAKGLLKESDSPGATLTYEDMAKYNVDLITSDQNNHKFIYPAYAS